ncbi:MAG: ATP-binding protein, partial [Gemmatimonadota bacterium]
MDAGLLVVNFHTELLEKLPDPLIALDGAWRITYANRGAAEVIGMPAPALAGLGLGEVYPSGWPELERRLRPAMGTDEVVEFEEHDARARRWYAVRAYRVHGGIAISFRDITQRKGRGERYRRSSELSRLVQEAAVVANETSEPRGAFNELVRRICGYTDWELGSVFLRSVEEEGTLRLHESWCHHAPAEVLERFRTLTESERFSAGVGLPGRVLATGAPAWIPDVSRDSRSPRAEAAREVGLRSAIAFPVRVGAEVVAVIEFFSRTLIEPDRELIETLETVGVQLGRVVERHEAAQAVERARAEAEAADQAKTEFIARMSHELRTPMNAILGFAQILEMDQLTSEQRESVDQILKGGRHLLLLINEVLDIARIEAGRLAISPEPVDLGDVLEQCLALVAPLAAARDITLPAKPGASNVFVRADRQRLVQALLNLLSNAIKYNRADGRVSIYTEAKGSRIRISVRDTGPGVSAERQSRLFKPFERLGADQSTIEGTGLGLALSKAFVEMMGGRIGLDCPSDGGSIFWIELEADRSQISEFEPESAPAVARREPSPPRARQSILYIEDNLSNVKLVDRILRRRPHVDLLTAMQGSLGIELAAQHRPSLILLDLNLPDLPGEEVLLRLRAEPASRDIPVLVVSADASTAQAERLKATG